MHPVCICLSRGPSGALCQLRPIGSSTARAGEYAKVGRHLIPPNLDGLFPAVTPMHILDARQFSPDWLLDTLFPLADTMRSVHQLGDSRVLSGKRLFYLFYQASTRTRLSFESA